MKKYLFISLFMSLFLLIVILLPGCSAADTEKELVVAAASSLTKAFTEVGGVFEKENNCTITFSFGSTGTLSEQIINGAPFDVFAAADEISVDHLMLKGYLTHDTKQIFTSGRLCIATSLDGSIKVDTMEDLLNPKIKKVAIANPEIAPYGLAAKQALENAGIWQQIEPKLVYGKNISETLTFIATGNAEAGFIALSLKDDAPLNFIVIDDALHVPINQAIAVIKTTSEEDLSKKFLAFVVSKEGQEIMRKYGLESPKE